MQSGDWTDGGGRARAASDALRDAAGWEGELRERIEGLSWQRIAGFGRRGRRLPGSGPACPPGRPRSRGR